MQFRFQFSRLANLFFFIHTLSGWHPSCRQEYVRWWKQNFKIPSRHQILLNSFKNILDKYWNEQNSFLGSVFFHFPDPFSVVKSLLSQSEFDTLKEGFSLFEDSFNRIYTSDEPMLREWSQTLSASFNVKHEHEKTLKILQILYHIKQLPEQIDVYLTLCSPPKGNGGGGGSVWDEKLLWIEISRMPHTSYPQVVGILFHELIHFIFERVHFSPLVRTHAPASNSLNEITSTVLFPRGVLAQRFLHVPPPPLEYYRAVPPSSIPRFLTLVHQYIKAKKPFDEVYIKQLAEIVKPDS